MRRFTLMSAAAAVALIATIPTGAAASDDARPITDATDVEVLRLECQPRVADTGPVVRCDWSAPTTPAAAGIKLFRLDPAVDDHRRVVYRSENVHETGFTDTHVRRGHRYAYAVVALSEDGRVVARSRAEWVRVPTDRDVEVLRLHCALGDAGEAVGCEWSRPQSRDAYVVSLWRSVDGGPRELVERFRPSGPNAYRDPVPADATYITYAVIATSESDVIVARSRPETVRVRVTDVALTDRLRRERTAP